MYTLNKGSTLEARPSSESHAVTAQSRAHPMVQNRLPLESLNPSERSNFSTLLPLPTAANLYNYASISTSSECHVRTFIYKLS